MTSLKRACGLLLVLALVLGLQAVAYAQTGAASITGLVTDQSGAAAPGVTVIGHEPGHQRRVHRRLERGGQLHHHVGAGRVVRREGRAFRLQDGDDEGVQARGEADCPPRLQDGGRRPRGRRRGDRPGSRAPDGVGHGGRGHLRQHGAVAPPERAQPRPAGPAPDGDADTQPGGLHEHRRGQPEPPLRERPPGAGEQLHAGRHRRERHARQPRRVPGQPRRPRRDQRGDEQLRGRHRQRGRSRGQQRHQVRREPVPGQRLRVLPQQRHGREHLGKQPLERGEGRAQAAHLRRHPGRPDHPEQALLLCRLPGVVAGCPRIRPPVGRAGRLAHR